VSAIPRYEGSCQCGAVTFDVGLDLEHTMVCNCSRCSRLGWIMCFTPAAEFNLRSGSEALSEYTFNREIVHHQFCRTCGIEPFAFGVRPSAAEKMVAVNVRCLDGIDLDGLAPRKVDGKSF
jgi:hypothetical protein